MELELGLALPPSPHFIIKEEFSFKIESKKRDFEEAFEIKTTLSLFPAKAGSDGDDNNHPSKGNMYVDSSLLKNAEKGLVVGWPPVKLSRRKSCGSNGYGGGEWGRRRANCVKVSMERMAIGRKVDLFLHNSYEELMSTLNQMFNWKQADDNNVADHHAFTVTYEDGDGDWLLVGDVPWKEFIQSAKRLKILN